MRTEGREKGKRGTVTTTRLLVLRSMVIALVGVGTVTCRGTLSPLSNRIAVGEEPFAVFVGDGEGGFGDLFAVGAGGGQVYQITFSRVDERNPALSPDGTLVAFLRSRTADDSAHRDIVLLNLLNGAERRIELPPGSVPDRRLGWAHDGRAVYVRTKGGLFRLGAPPADPAPAPVNSADSSLADSALAVVLGEPPFALAIECGDGSGVCVVDRAGKSDRFDEEGLGPARWGSDSVGYFRGGDVLIRPLGAGTARILQWSRTPPHPRELTVFLPSKSASSEP